MCEKDPFSKRGVGVTFLSPPSSLYVPRPLRFLFRSARHEELNVARDHLLFRDPSFFSPAPPSPVYLPSRRFFPTPLCGLIFVPPLFLENPFTTVSFPFLFDYRPSSLLIPLLDPPPPPFSRSYFPGFKGCLLSEFQGEPPLFPIDPKVFFLRSFSPLPFPPPHRHLFSE